MTSIIEVDNAIKKYPETIALNRVSVSFEKNQIHGIIGRNGSGKTVLLRAICGFIPLTSGNIFVREKQVGQDIDIPPDLGAIIEHPGFLPRYSGFRNLLMLAQINNVIGTDRIREVIKLVGLDPDSKKHVSKYSMGMKQRLAIAQAIMEDPDILILDEPMNGLDKSGVEEIRSLLLQLKKQDKTILIASHNANDIDILCDTVYEMDAGEIQRIR